ncbi:MAG: glycoside hydrolase [candidate division WOR-3 bacterium]|nr:glycoside hydrolase [candidate division WOR-3 bacterium]
MNLLTKLFLLSLFFRILYATPVVVSGGPENDYESWIARLDEERLMIVFDRNPDWVSGDIYVSFATDNGNTWSSPSPVIVKGGNQATLSFVQLLGDTIRLWFATNESDTYGIYSAYSMDGLSWTEEGRINLGWASSDMYYDPNVILESDSSLTMSYHGPDGGYIAHCPKNGSWDTLLSLCTN